MSISLLVLIGIDLAIILLAWERDRRSFVYLARGISGEKLSCLLRNLQTLRARLCICGSGISVRRGAHLL